MKKRNNLAPDSSTSSESLYNLLLKITDLVPGLIAVYNINTGKYIYVNDSIKKILGYSKDEWLTKGLPFVASLVHPDDVESIMVKNAAALKKANSKSYRDLDNNPIASFEYRVKHKNGTWRWLKTDGVIFDRNKEGKVENVMNISIDITERKSKEDTALSKQLETQDELSSSRDQLEVVLKNVADGVTVQNLSGKLIYANETAAHASGYSSSRQMLSAKPDDFLDRFEIQGENGAPISLSQLPGRRVIAGEIDPHAILRYVNKKTKAVRWSIVRASLIKKKGTPYVIVNTIQDITEMKRVQEEQSRIAAIVESSDDAIISKTLEGIITSWNASAEKLFGYKSHEAVGRHITLIIPPEHRSEEDRIISRIKKGLRINHFETVRYRKDKSKVFVSLSISPVKDGMGNIIGAAKIARDVTKQKELEKQRDDFISIATHELKTPVTSVKAYAQVLERIFLKKHDVKSAQYLAKMDAQLSRLTSLIGELLDVNKIQSGHMHFKKQLFSINSLIDEVTEELQRTTQKHKIIKKLDKDVQVPADRDRIGQVLTNLITNAIKYSPSADKIIVSSDVENNTVTVRVKDYGIGIPKSMLDKVFDKFFRISSPKNETFPGMGLGLHISSEFIKRQGGKIWAKSAEGKGSLFSFSLPIKKTGAARKK